MVTSSQVCERAVSVITPPGSTLDAVARDRRAVGRRCRPARRQGAVAGVDARGADLRRLAPRRGRVGRGPRAAADVVARPHPERVVGAVGEARPVVRRDHADVADRRVVGLHVVAGQRRAVGVGCRPGQLDGADTGHGRRDRGRTLRQAGRRDRGRPPAPPAVADAVDGPDPEPVGGAVGQPGEVQVGRARRHRRPTVGLHLVLADRAPLVAWSGPADLGAAVTTRGSRRAGGLRHAARLLRRRPAAPRAPVRVAVPGAHPVLLLHAVGEVRPAVAWMP